MDGYDPIEQMTKEHRDKIRADMLCARYEKPMKVTKIERASQEECKQANLDILTFLKKNAKEIVAGTLAVVVVAAAGNALLDKANERTDAMMQEYDRARESIAQTYDAQAGNHAFDNLSFERQQELIARQIEEMREQDNEKSNGVK